MANQPRNKKARRQSWLEYMPIGGGPLQRRTLDVGRLTIGRCESTDLQIDSTRVSREHACLEVSGETVVIRDLNSTNGTFVNGETIREAQLKDGDVITVADADITFLTNSTSRLRRMATQPLPAGSSSSRDQRHVGHSTRSNIQAERQAVDNLRAAHEVLLQGAASVDLKPVIDVTTRRTFAHLARQRQTPSGAIIGMRYTAPPSHAAVRMIQMHRSVAVQQIDAVPDCFQLILPFETWEITECERLLWSLEELTLTAPTGVRVVAAINANDAVDLDAARDFCQSVKSAQIDLALTGFVGGAAHIAGLAGIEPNLLFLAGELTDDLLQKPRLRRQTPTIVDACREANINPVASGVNDQPTLDFLAGEGVRLFVDSPCLSSEALDVPAARDAAFAASH